MVISQFTDYSLRVLLYLGLKGEKATVNEIASSFRISRNHLVKVVHSLSQQGFLKSQKGKNGGINLAVDPSTVRIGDFIARLEPMELLECFNVEHNTCPIQGTCELERSLHAARKAFIDSLNQQTLASYLVQSRSRTERMLRLGLIYPKPESA